MTLYKVTAADGSALIGNGNWNLPDGDQPGEWMPVIDRVVPCSSGYHVCLIRKLLDHVCGSDPVVWEVEVRGTVVDAGNKIVASEARLLRATPLNSAVAWRLLATDFAAHVHQYFHRVRPDDNRVRDAIRVARDYAHGRCDAAARDAAGVAARDAAWVAARAAWDATGDDASDAAWAASRAAAMAAADAAAWDAARAAARAAARDAAESGWQTRLIADILAGRRKPGTVRITTWKEA